MSKKGVITAVKKGAATITCYVDKEKIASCKVTVLPAPSKVKLPWKTLNIGKKESVQLVPIIKDGTMASFTYTTKDKKIASVSAKGVVKGLKVGKKTTITVTTQNKKKVNLTVNVMNAPEKVTLDQKTATITAGDTLQLKATLPKKTASQLTWKSGNKKVVTVDENGLVTAVSAGTTKITVTTFNKKKATCTVTVAPQVTSIAIDENNFPDETFRNYVKRFDTDGNEQLSNEEIAAVTEIDVSGRSINSLVGIEFFVSLKKLECSYTDVSALNLASNTALNHLGCHDCQLTSLDLSNNTELEVLGCGNVEAERRNHLTTLDLSHNRKLTSLQCINAHISLLNIHGCTSLVHIKCYENDISKIDVSGCTSLKSLECQGNRLTSLDVSGCPLAQCLIDGQKEDYEGWTSYSDSDCFLSVDSDVQLTPTPVVVTGIAINESNFPDANFRSWVLANCDSDGDKCLSDAEIAAVTSIAAPVSTASLKGIEFFTALTQLDCDHTNLTELDLSHNTALVELRCHDAKLTSLDLSKNRNLKRLYCGNLEPERTNQLTMLDLSHNSKLTYLHCTDTQLISLNVSGCAALGGIKCYGNQLTTLNVKGCTSLEALEGQRNNLTTLDVSDSPALVACLTNGKKETFNGWVSYTSEEYCLNVDADVVLTPTPVVVTGIAINESNFPDANFRSWVQANCDIDEDGELSSAEIVAVTSINVEDMGIVSLAGIGFFTDLKSLNCHNNITLKAFDLSHNTKLEELECSNTGITSLDISNNTNLKRLACCYTQLSSLNVRTNVRLESLKCYDCKLTALDLAQNTQLKELWCMNLEYGNRFTELDISHNTNLEGLWCYSVGLTTLDVSYNSALKELNCHDNNLATLTLGENSVLMNLNCAWNSLSVLDVSKCQKLADCITKGTKRIVSGSVSNPDYYVSYTYDGYLSVDPDVQLTPAPVIVTGIAIDENNFPDETFRTYVKGFDTDGDKRLSDEEISAVTSINVSFLNISNLGGIEFFTTLTTLECTHTNLTELDLSHNVALVELRCHDAKLTSLDLSKNRNLKRLYCGNVEPERTNQLTMLDLSHNSKLTYLHCADTQLISLNVSGCAALGGIKCYGNQLTTLNVKGCTSLEALEGQRNNLTTLDVSDSPALVACLTNGKKETFDGWVSYTSEEYCLNVDADVILTPAPVVVNESKGAILE